MDFFKILFRSIVTKISHYFFDFTSHLLGYSIYVSGNFDIMFDSDSFTIASVSI